MILDWVVSMIVKIVVNVNKSIIIYYNDFLIITIHWWMYGCFLNPDSGNCNDTPLLKCLIKLQLKDSEIRSIESLSGLWVTCGALFESWCEGGRLAKIKYLSKTAYWAEMLGYDIKIYENKDRTINDLYFIINQPISQKYIRSFLLHWSDFLKIHPCVRNSELSRYRTRLYSKYFGITPHRI